MSVVGPIENMNGKRFANAPVAIRIAIRTVGIFRIGQPLVSQMFTRGLTVPFFSFVFAALLLFGWSQGATATDALTRSVDLPIFVYHHIRPGVTSALFVSPEDFDKQLQYIQDNGFHTISFTDLADYLETGKALPQRPAIISLDDGWADQFEYGFPILQKHLYAATFYVVTNYLDHEDFMTTEQLRALVAAGMTIGCHTRSHPYLTSVGRERAWDEIAGAKKRLEAAGITVDTFAYPYGAYDRMIVDMVKAAGFRSARTINAGIRATADELDTLPGITFRTFINSYARQVTL